MFIQEKRYERKHIRTPASPAGAVPVPGAGADGVAEPIYLTRNGDGEMVSADRNGGGADCLRSITAFSAGTGTGSGDPQTRGSDPVTLWQCVCGDSQGMARSLYCRGFQYGRQQGAYRTGTGTA